MTSLSPRRIIAPSALAFVVALLTASSCLGFDASSSALFRSPAVRVSRQPSSLSMASTIEPPKEKTKLVIKNKKEYVPKWKKSATLAESLGDASAQPSMGSTVGAIPVSFQTGVGEDASFVNTTASPGMRLDLVASQSGQFIKYGCGAGKCGTCESFCNGKYVRPCVDVVPSDLPIDPNTGLYFPMIIKVKATKAKVVSSGKFFSVKSFLMGFWNNLLGMFGVVRDRGAAKKNWEDRMTFEERVAELTTEKRRLRLEREALVAATALALTLSKAAKTIVTASTLTSKNKKDEGAEKTPSYSPA